MDKGLQKELANSIFRFRKVGQTFHQGIRLHMSEVFILHKISENEFDSKHNALMSDIQCELHITKPAISQTLNSLEKKGYINRLIDEKDRRRFILKLTPKGERTVASLKQHIDQVMEEIISRFGEENTNQLIKLFNRFADISEEVKLEAPTLLNLKQEGE